MAEPQPPSGERTRMSSETFTQQWAQIRQHLQGWWDRLTEQDLEEIAGQQDQLVRVIQERYQVLRERAQDEVDQRLQAYQTAGSSMAEAFIAAAEEAASRVTQTAEPGQAATAGLSVLDRCTSACRPWRHGWRPWSLEIAEEKRWRVRPAGRRMGHIPLD